MGIFAEDFPQLAKEWHPTKNGDLMPTDVTSGSHKKIWWFLPYDDPKTGKHFDFEWCATINARTSQHLGCPFLAKPCKALWVGFNDLATTHPKLAKEWHPTKNGDLMPTDVVVGSNKKVWWFLPYDDPKTGKHFDFEWESTIASRVSGNQCPYLSGKDVWIGFNDLATLYPELAKEWHPTKNDGLEPEFVTAGSKQKVWWFDEYRKPMEYKAMIRDRVYRFVKQMMEQSD